MSYKRTFLCGVAVLMGALPAIAADHNDAPAVMGAERSYVDITDVYAFRSPANPDNLVVSVAMFSPVVAATPPYFDSDARYEIYIDSDGDSVADSTISATFEDGPGTTQTFEIRGTPGAELLRGAVTPGANAIVAADGEVRAFAGLRDDHFFFDLTAFQSFVSAPCLPAAGIRCPGAGDPQNFFATFNAATIVVEFPATAVPGISSPDSGTISVWAKTFGPDSDSQ